MPYKEIKYMELKEIVLRSKDGQSISSIARSTKIDRKTIRKYLGLLVNGAESNHEEILHAAKRTKKRAEKQVFFSEYTEEITLLLNREKSPLKIKSVYEVLCRKYGLEGKSSLSSFKRFLKSMNISRKVKGITCRIERKPGEEVQVDYAYMGKMPDPVTGKVRKTYAFIGSLPYSRHKFVEFVFSQDQASFVESHIRMFSYFGGVPHYVTPDNLKSGVIKPGLYNPELNRLFREMAEHYGCFINPARVARPKDKPTVERDVQTIREEFLKMREINPGITLNEANKEILSWLVNVYGKRKHSTTQELPMESFTGTEAPLLRPLPADPFEVAEWKQAKVHPDCFLQVNKKHYSVPFVYAGFTLWVKVKMKTVEIYHHEKLIKTHLTPKTMRQTDYNDFPENISSTIDKDLPAYLQKHAFETGGEKLRAFIRELLSPHAFINLRRAQAILRATKDFDRTTVEQAAVIATGLLPGVHPKEFRKLLESFADKKKAESLKEEENLIISDGTNPFIRPITYFNSQTTN